MSHLEDGTVGRAVTVSAQSLAGTMSVGGTRQAAIEKLSVYMLKKFGANNVKVIEEVVKAAVPSESSGSAQRKISTEKLEEIELEIMKRLKRKKSVSGMDGRRQPATTRPSTGTRLRLSEVLSSRIRADKTAQTRGNTAAATRQLGEQDHQPGPSSSTRHAVTQPPKAAGAPGWVGVPASIAESILSATTDGGPQANRRVWPGDIEGMVERPWFVPPGDIPKPVIGRKLPVDGWDVVQDIDRKMYEDSEKKKAEVEAGKREKYKKGLEGQTREIEAMREERREQKRRDMEESLRQQQRARAEEEEEQRRRAAAVEAVLAACRDAERQKKMRDDMKREIFRLEQERTRQMTEEEDRRLEAERQKAAAEAARRAAENAEQRDREAEWKRKRREQEARDAEEQNRQQKEMYDRMERMREAALQARLDKIQRINRSVGKALGDSMEAKARADEERMMKEVELREKRLTQLENEKRQKWAQAQRDMLDTLARQCEERKRQKEMEKMESDKQADIFRKTVKDGIEEDARKAEARRQRRWQQDQDLKSQIREARLTKWYQPISLTELEYNQNIFRDMAKGQILPAETLQSFLLPEDHKLTKKAYRNRMPGPKPDPTEAEGAGSLLEGGGRTEAEGAPTIVTFN